MAEHKFKVGDRVIALHDGFGDREHAPYFGTINQLDEHVRIVMDKPLDGFQHVYYLYDAVVPLTELAKIIYG